jgi:hypothetical protein
VAQPGRPLRVGQADEQRPDLVAVGDEAADQERLALVMLGLEPVPGPPAGQVAALEPLGHHPLRALDEHLADAPWLAPARSWLFDTGSAGIDPPGRSVVISAIIGTPIVLAVVGFFVRRRGATRL